MISTRELLARIVALERLLKCAVLNNNETTKIVISNTDTFIIPTETISGYDINLSEEFVNLVNSKLPKPTEEYSPSFDKVIVIDSNGLTSVISINDLGEDNIIESISVNDQIILPFDKNINIETFWIPDPNNNDVLVPRTHKLINNSGGTHWSNTLIGPTTSIPTGSTANYNIFIGAGVASSLMSGGGSIAFGYGALAKVELAHNMIAIGTRALGSLVNIPNTSTASIAIGGNSLARTTVASNNAFGSAAGYNVTTGRFNIFIGESAGFSNVALTGDNNIFIGMRTGLGASSGSNNTVLGNLTQGATTGSNNTLLGARSTSFTTGSNNTLVGHATGLSGISNTVIIADGNDGIRFYSPEVGRVGLGTRSPEITAALDIVSTTRGILIPRLSTEQRNAIGNPANGLLIYNVDTNSFNYYNSNVWTTIGDDYTLTPATSTHLGGIKADEKTESFTKEVRIDANTSKLYVEPSTNDSLPLEITSNFLLSIEHNRRVVCIKGDVIMTIPINLNINFSELAIDVETGSLTVAVTNGVIVTGYYSLVFQAGETAFLYRPSQENLNKYRLV